MKKILLFLFWTTLAVSSIEPVLLRTDGTPIEDNELFHQAHGKVRDWQFNRTYGPTLLPPEKLQEELKPMNIQAKFVPLSFWEICCVSLSITDPSFASLLLNQTHALIDDHAYSERASKDPLAINQEIVNLTKDADFSSIKKRVDTYLLTTFPEADTLEGIKHSIPALLEKITHRFKTLQALHSFRTFPEDSNVSLPHVVTSTPLIKGFYQLSEFPYLFEKICAAELNFNHLLLLRATTPLSHASFLLQDSVINLKDRTSLSSVSYDTSLLGGALFDPSANPLHYYAQGGGQIIYGIYHPLPLLPQEDLFFIPPIWGPAHLIREGESTHARTRILKGYGAGRATYQRSEIIPSLYTTRPSLEAYAQEFHRTIAERLHFVLPPLDEIKEQKDSLYNVEEMKRANKEFADTFTSSKKQIRK